jgi:hypothetical protein
MRSFRGIRGHGNSSSNGNVINVQEDFGANPSGSSDDTSKILNALERCQSINGTLFFPNGVWNLSQPIILTKSISIMGNGHGSEIRYTGSGYCIQSNFSSTTDASFIDIGHLKITGTNALGQGGIKLGDSTNGISRSNICQTYIESFGQGTCIYLLFPIQCAVNQNHIGGSIEGITLESCVATEVNKNFLSYWADYAIRLFSVDSAIAPRNNEVKQNMIHGNGVINQLSLKDRAGIKLERMSSTKIDNNYFEIIKSPPSAITEVGHGIWIDGPDGELSQANTISNNNYGPGTTGKAFKLSGLTSHTSIESNTFGVYQVDDSGLYTNYKMQNFSTADQVTGSSTTKRGWISHGVNTVLQYHT